MSSRLATGLAGWTIERAKRRLSSWKKSATLPPLAAISSSNSAASPLGVIILVLLAQGRRAGRPEFASYAKARRAVEIITKGDALKTGRIPQGALHGRRWLSRTYRP